MAEPNKTFDPAEFHRTLERMAEGTDYGQTDPRPEFNARLQEEVARESIHGRRIEEYQKALEGQGFVFVPAHLLPGWNNGRPRTEGEWRCQAMKMSFTEENVLSMFETPQVFWEWAEQRKNLNKIAAEKAARLKKIRVQVPR